MKNENGAGNIYKIRGKRRKPWGRENNSRVFYRGKTNTKIYRDL